MSSFFSAAAAAATAQDSEDDDLVLDVYYNGEVDDMFLMQQPSQPSWRGFDGSQVTQATYKPLQKAIELVHGDEHMGDKRVLRSTFVQPNPALQYFIAVNDMHGGLHLTPVQGVFQMRPSFKHLDADAASLAAAEAQEKKDREEHEEGESSGDDAPKAVDISFKRRETERQAARRRTASAHMQLLEAQEQPLTVNFFCEVLQNQAEYARLAAPSDAQPIAWNVEGADFLHHMHRPHQAGDALARAAHDAIKGSQVLAERVKSLLANASILDTERVVKLLQDRHGQPPRAEIVLALRVTGTLVRGVWVATSDTLGLTQQHQRAPWEYLLLQLHTHGAVSRPLFTKTFNLKPADARDFLVRLCSPPSDDAGPEEQGVWRMKITDDAYATTAEALESMRQAAPSWANRERVVNTSAKVQAASEQRSKVLSQRANATGGAGGDEAARKVKRAMRKSRRVLDEAIAELRLDSSSAQLFDWMSEYMLQNQALTGTMVREALNPALRNSTANAQLARFPALLASQPSYDSILQCLELLAQDYHGVFVLRSVGDPKQDLVRDLILALFEKRPHVRSRDIKEMLHSQLPPEALPSDKQWKAIVAPFADAAPGGNWTLKHFEQE